MVDAVAIVSGGMDSVTMLHYLVKRENKEPAVLSFTYGQKHSKEIESAQYQVQLLSLKEYRVIDLSMLTSAFERSALVSDAMGIPDISSVKGDPQPVTYVPNRNMIFLAIAAAFAENFQVCDVYYGAQAHDLYGYWDTTPDFLERINSLLSLNRKTKIEIQAPLVNYSKTAVLKLGLELDVDYGKTWSCYKGAELACGKCPTCVERVDAFKNLEMVDPIKYA